METKDVLLQKMNERLSVDPIDVQLGCILINQNLFKGSNWALVRREDPMYESTLSVFSSSTSFSIFPTKDGFIVTAKLELILQKMAYILPEIYDARAKNEIVFNQTSSQKDLLTLLESGIQGGIISIFSTSDSDTIYYNGMYLKNFRVDLAMACFVLERMGYYIEVNGSYYNPNDVLQSYENLCFVTKSSMMAPSSDGLLLKIRKG